MQNEVEFINYVKNLDRTVYKLPIYLGLDQNDSPAIVDFPDVSSILMLGSKGSGKTMFAHTTICSIINSFPSEYVKFLLIDLKEPEFSLYENSSYLIEKPKYNPSDALRALDRISNTPSDRYNVILIDTFSELMLNYGIILTDIIKRLTNRKNTFVIMWDSKPYEEIFTPEIKQCFTSKIIFNLGNIKDAKLLSDKYLNTTPQNTGEAMVFCKQNSNPIFVRCPYISDEEIMNVVR